MNTRQPTAAPAVVLASGSAHRRKLLERLGIPFQWHAPEIDETPETGEDAAAMATRLARQKARAVAGKHPDSIVIGSDQLAVLEGRVLGKPADLDAALDQLRAASGKPVEFLTAVCVLDTRAPGAEPVLHIDITRVQFRQLSEAAARSYVAKDQPMDCAGSFRSEGLGIVLCERIDARDPTGLVGLPLIWLSGVLGGLGVEIL